jgi:streptogramin lyase
VAITGLAPAPDGALWFTEIDEDPATYMTTRAFVGRIDPRSLQITRTMLPTHHAGVCPQVRLGEYKACIPEGIVVAPDGTVWFGLSSGNLGRLAPHSTLHVESLPVNPGDVAYLAASETGTIAVGSFTRSICQIDAVDHRWCIQATAAPDDFAGLVYDQDGVLWFTAACSNAIGHIAKDGRVSMRHIPGTAAHTPHVCPPPA